jgi:hypothetical protein
MLWVEKAGMSFWAFSTWTSMKDYKTTELEFIGNHLTILLLKTHTRNIKSPEQQLPCKLERVWEMVKKQAELTDNRPAFWIPKNFIVDSMQAWDFQISFLMWHRWWIESPWCTCMALPFSLHLLHDQFHQYVRQTASRYL